MSNLEQFANPDTITGHDIRTSPGDEVSVKKKLFEAKPGERCCVIGTLFKKMELKPSILKEISTTVRQFLATLALPSLPLHLISSDVRTPPPPPPPPPLVPASSAAPAS